ncbi:MAG: hypothetical protein GOU97_04625 [Nanoarchaeota archaeon]|nr:hypothetical protein [Nanoarchaeota archaeon]
MKKGQIAVPVALILFIILFVFYIIWVQPPERQRLLNPENEVISGDGNATLGEHDLFHIIGIGWVGKGTGEPLMTHDFGTASLDYPLIGKDLESMPQLRLTTSIFSAGTYTKSLNFDESGLERITVSFKTGTVIGTPTINVFVDSKNIYSETAVNGQIVSLDLDNNVYEGTHTLRIECVFKGMAFWETQVCGLNSFKIVEHAYSLNVNEVAREFSLSSVVDGTAKIYFKVVNAQTSGTMSIRLNDVLIYNGKPSEREARYQAEVSTTSAGLTTGINTISFSTSPGGVYDLSDVQFSLFEKDVGVSSYDIYYNVPGDVVDKASNFTVEYDLANMAPNGGLEFVFRQVTKYERADSINRGYNRFILPSSEINLGSNKLTITSQEGRFNLNSVRMYWN